MAEQQQQPNLRAWLGVRGSNGARRSSSIWNKYTVGKQVRINARSQLPVHKKFSSSKVPMLRLHRANHGTHNGYRAKMQDIHMQFLFLYNLVHRPQLSVAS
jgi:hypothetical protein